MRLLGYASIGAAIALVLSGCSAVRPEGRFICAHDSDCPATMRCYGVRCFTLPPDAGLEASVDSATIDSATIDAAMPTMLPSIPLDLTAFMATGGNGIGSSVAISGDGTHAAVAVVHTGSAAGPSEVVVFVRAAATWTEEARLFASSSTPCGSVGGLAFDRSASRLVVGCIEAGNMGGARSFDRVGSSWSEGPSLEASGALAGDGWGVGAISGDGSRVVLASANAVRAGVQTGGARVLVRGASAWTEEADLLPAGAAQNDRFGCATSISLDGTRIAVGAFGEATTAGGTGNVHVFVRASSWTEEASLLDATNGDIHASYGASVAMSTDGSRIVVLALGSLPMLSFARGASWTAEMPFPGAWSTAVAIDGNGERALLGTTSRTVHVLGRASGNWWVTSLIDPPTGTAADGLSGPLDVSDDGKFAVIGDPNYIEPGSGGSYAGRAVVVALP